MNCTDFVTKFTGISPEKIDATLQLFDEGGTIPFIARYRKEKTGNLNEEQIDQIRKEAARFDQLQKRKQTILNSIEEQGKLSTDLKERIEGTMDLNSLEDMYLPYRVKKQTKVERALKSGLRPLAGRLMKQENGDPIHWAESFICDDYPTEDEVLQGALDIMAEWVNENEVVRTRLRTSFLEHGVLTCKVVPKKKEEAAKYQDYFDFRQVVHRCAPHRLLAIFRGEKEGFLKVRIEPDEEYLMNWLRRFFIKNSNESAGLVEKAIRQAYKKSLQPSLETEVRNHFKDLADDQSIHTFSENLENLLLSAPVGNKRTLAIDPGFRSGCKVVVLSESGELVHNETVYPHPPQNESAKASATIQRLVESNKVEVIAIGDGTAGRETESWIKRIRFSTDLNVFVVREDGASVYSASKVAREEFPEYDVTVRGAVSIGRRLMDPLAELVKIDPKSLGVGQYQHDVNQSKLQSELDRVVESAVNKVGVDVNTASKYLLKYVSGLGDKLAENIVLHRSKNGLFKSREDLKKVERMGDKAFQLSAGFLRIRGAENPLDNSAVHPENYPFVNQLLVTAGMRIQEVLGDREKISDLAAQAKRLQMVGELTLQDILKELEKPGLDPRRTAKVLEFSKDIKVITDVIPGMILNGIVTNVTDFGAFVNIGIKDNGLIHKNHFFYNNGETKTRTPRLHDHVRVRVLDVDYERKRIGLGFAEAE